MQGLTESEALLRLKTYGYNEIPERRESIILSFLKKFTGLTAYTIEAAIAVSYILGRYIDLMIMAFLLLFNSIIGVLHESRAEKAVNLLRKRITVETKVLRDGNWRTIPSRELVPGDIVKVMIGDIVPADLKVIEGSVSVDQSTLTGESLPVERGRGDILYSGSSIVRGGAIAEVVATGPKTYFGRTAELVQIGKPRLIIERITSSVTKGLLLADLAFIAMVAVKLFISKISIEELLPFSLTLLIASIPVALPAMTTITLALGALELSKNGVLVRRLESIEGAAMMDVVCIDKTGTLTENKLYVTRVIPLDGYNEKDVVLYALLASEKITKDPIDLAISEYAAKLGISREGYFVVEFHTFDPSLKRSEAVVRINSEEFSVMKGAPQVISEISARSVDDLLEKLSNEGCRALAIAVRKKGVVSLVGLIGLQDRPREDSKKLVSKLKELGVNPKMITGDNILIAKNIAEEVGIGCRAVSIREGGIKLIENADALAEVIPEDKYNVVSYLQEKGHVVGMTGDGVNDAPALKKADVGIAVKNSTDVAKASASVILTSEGLKNIVDLIIIGRTIYRRITLWIINKVVKTFQIVYFVAISTLFLGIPVISPTQMILMLFMYDFVTISISTDRAKPSKMPERWNLRKLLLLSSLLGGLKIIELFIALYIALSIGLDINQVRSFIFYVLLVSGLLNILNFRERGFFWSSKPSNAVLFSIFTDILVATFVVISGFFMARISLYHTMIALLYTFIVTLVFTDVIKISIYKKIQI
ncbi:MAG: plasma-membrane proton-efflux P-type ATPase [Candidatus Methanodesulfokora sp.]|nr:MAG: plasma-membrane proton-efflux P-type ATPase [Candidatus Korarchaeota archaeon]